MDRNTNRQRGRQVQGSTVSRARLKTMEWTEIQPDREVDRYRDQVYLGAHLRLYMDRNPKRLYMGRTSVCSVSYKHTHAHSQISPAQWERHLVMFQSSLTDSSLTHTHHIME